jgi:hypothetical protein
MRRLLLALGSAALLTAAITAPVAARTVLIQLTGDGTAAVECLEGGAPPCAETALIELDGTVSGSPFDDVKGVKPPILLAGTLEVRTATLDPVTGCYHDVLGVLAFSVARGPNGKLAFELDVRGVFCHGGFTGTFEVDPSGSQVSAFRNSTGTGVMILTTDVDPATADSGVFTVAFSGTMALVR